jgi:sulfhydrogenase subunit beta (sulfur reductase)
MASDELAKIFLRLKKEKYKIFGPKKEDGEIKILELESEPDAELFQRISDRPWKYFFTPTREILYKYEGSRPKTFSEKQEKTALFGMSIFDCKALELYDRVFRDDFYYGERRKNILIVGFSPRSLAGHKTIFFELKKNILESAVFDIFFERAGGHYNFYARGKAGEAVLKSCGIRHYKKVDYKKRENDKSVAAIKAAVENSKESKLWNELGKICLACGKCAIACPTCYCFDLESKIGPSLETERCSGNCFYDDFTRIAGGHKFLNNPKEKIFFWYFHKFVRIPHQYGLPGCVDCGRCTAVCPVGIDIGKNIERLLKETKK